MVVSSDAGLDAAVVWHDLECGGYRVDLPTWQALAARACSSGEGDGVLDIGAGTGRVALELARAGRRVLALDRVPSLLAALTARAGELPVRTVTADARGFELESREHCMCIVPMQTIQLLRGSVERVALMRSARRHLRPGGLFAAAIVTAVEPFDSTAGSLGPSPERVRLGGRLYVSRAVRVITGERFIRIERERYVSVEADHPDPSQLAAAGPASDVVELERVTIAQLHAEGHEAGLRPEPTLFIEETSEHSGSEVVVMRA